MFVRSCVCFLVYLLVCVFVCLCVRSGFGLCKRSFVCLVVVCVRLCGVVYVFVFFFFFFFFFSVRLLGGLFVPLFGYWLRMCVFVCVVLLVWLVCLVLCVVVLVC